MGDTDERRPIKQTDSEKQFRATGKLVCMRDSGPYISTASLIQTKSGSHALILSAAHAYININTGEEYQHCRFYPMASEQAFRVKNVIRGDTEKHGWSGDWAVAQLDIKADSLSLPQLNIKKLNPYDFLGQELYQVQYNIDTARIEVASECQLYQMELWTLRHGNAIFIHDCDVRSGGSGGPVMVKSGDDFQLLGIYIGSDSKNSNYIIGAKEDFTPFDLSNFVNVAIKINDDIINAINKLTSE